MGTVGSQMGCVPMLPTLSLGVGDGMGADEVSSRWGAAACGTPTSSWDPSGLGWAAVQAVKKNNLLFRQ